MTSLEPNLRKASSIDDSRSGRQLSLRQPSCIVPLSQVRLEHMCDHFIDEALEWGQTSSHQSKSLSQTTPLGTVRRSCRLITAFQYVRKKGLELCEFGTQQSHSQCKALFVEWCMYDTVNVLILFARHILALFWAITQVSTDSRIEVIEAFTAVSYFGSHGIILIVRNGYYEIIPVVTKVNKLYLLNYFICDYISCQKNIHYGLNGFQL